MSENGGLGKESIGESLVGLVRLISSAGESMVVSINKFFSNEIIIVRGGGGGGGGGGATLY